MTVARRLHEARTALERAQVCANVLATAGAERAPKVRAEAIAQLDAVIAIATAAKVAFQ